MLRSTRGSLSNKVALITGASRGIGRQIAIEFANAGARVIVNHLGPDNEAADVIREIRNFGGNALAIRADVSRERPVRDLFAEITSKCKTLDILVNNVGIENAAPVDRMTLKQWNQVVRTNLTGTFLCTREAVRLFKQRHSPKRHLHTKKILCISSIHDHIPYPCNANYAASKGGLTQFIRTVADEVGVHGITVNGISPGFIQTERNKGVWSDKQRRTTITKLVPRGRLGTPLDIAKVALCLVSDSSDYVTGTTVVVDGGISLYSGIRELIEDNLRMQRELETLHSQVAANSQLIGKLNHGNQ